MSLSDQESTEQQFQGKQEPNTFDEGEKTSVPHDANKVIGHEETGSDETGHEQEDPKANIHKKQFDKFLSDLEVLGDLESKLQLAVSFMEASLSQGSTPHFKSFWEARNICLQLFKENISPTVRTILWAKYSDLSKEARRLKEILDEQSAFAVEQIEIAIQALETDISGVTSHLDQAAHQAAHQAAPGAIDISSRTIMKNLAVYEKLQRELALLNTQASRIKALRKELIRTEMRVRQKNKFFQRLSAAGDKVFPRRKELIKEISQIFLADIEGFITTHFSGEEFREPLFVLREEIKALQNVAKTLTLNTHTFTQTRMRLSECWDKIKTEDKERKKERHQQKEIYKKNFGDSMLKIEEFKKDYEERRPNPMEATKQLDELVANIRSLELGKEELHALREAVQGLRKPIQEQIQAKEQERVKHDQEKEKARRQQIQDLKQKAEALVQEAETLDAETIESRRDEVLEAVGVLPMAKLEKQEIERQLKSLRDLISEKKEKSLLALSEGDRQSLQQLKEVLKQRKERRQEIKTQIDQLRKASGISGFDFEQAMNINAQVASEKERLEKIEQGIEEIEEKIAQLKRLSS